MFNSLHKLYKRHNDSGKTPLEDFNTECFANILVLYPDIRADFINNFLGLPNDEYKIITQLRKNLPDDDNCIIDLVFEGRQHVCLVENKVESEEGYNQLIRYGKVLDLHYANQNKYLFYCTKYSDPKNHNNEYEQYNFRQFKWYEIAKFLKKYRTENPLINDYINFLNENGMAQDNTFKPENFIAMESMAKTLEIVNFHIDNAAQEFDKLFGKSELKDSQKWEQVSFQNRLSRFVNGVLESQPYKTSEILYSIEFNTLSLSVHIHVNEAHEQLSAFEMIDLSNTQFKLEKFGHGSTIFKLESLGKFLNDENSDKYIKDWFGQSFNELRDLIKANPQLNWRFNFEC
jgi:hypothetical protein